ncbi:inositol monophosphatase family protein [Inquilinus sp.]|jgi:myo-inositol-1(or 4)-monophosphatase|uniref:inositol monophosphatase family protein n=1 Tax=Inquilinus sp. TaxID=1932117 RepID=UPI0037831A77
MLRPPGLPADTAALAPTDRSRRMLQAALAGAEAIRVHAGRWEGAALERKGARDFVTAADRQSEAAVAASLSAAFPDHAIEGEEGTAIRSQGAGTLLVDPIDGTTNFAWGLPFFGIAIALVEGGETVAGVVLDPSLGEAFVAERGHGAFLNGRRLRIDRTVAPEEALVGASLPVPGQVRSIDVEAYHRALRAVIDRAAGVRRLGSAALSLCYVAAGRHDAFFEDGLSPLDYAAAVLVLREAGGVATGFDGRPIPDSGAVLGANAGLHPWLVGLLGGGD